MNQPSREFSEKRNFIRMQINTPASMSLKHGDDTLEGTCVNLSGGGLLAEVNKVVPVGAEVEITVASGHGHNPMLTAKAKVTRITTEQAETCTLGLEILEMMN